MPYGFPGISAPVEEVYPSFIPFITFADGSVYSASDGSDEIVPAADGMSLKTVNRKWARIGSKSGERFENGLISVVEWKLVGNRLTRAETVTANVDVEIKAWKFALPTTASGLKEIGANSYILSGREGALGASFKPFSGTSISVLAAGDGRLGKGVLGAIPIHIVAEAVNLKLRKGETLRWELSLELLK
jgi:hypothetical protein